MPVVRGLAHSVNEADLEQVEKSFEVLNAFLEDRQYAAGDNMTIADFSISTTISMILVSILYARDDLIIPGRGSRNIIRGLIDFAVFRL